MKFREYLNEVNILDQIDAFRDKNDAADEFMYNYLINKYPDMFTSKTLVDEVLELVDDSDLKDLYKEMKKSLK